MNNLHLLILLLSLHQISSVISNNNATDSIFFSCGTNQSSVSPDGRNWISDSRSKFGPFNELNQKSIAAEAIEQATSTVPVPYMSARISRSQFTYIFPVTSGQKFIRLHFCPTKYTGGFSKFKDWFDVRVGPYTFLRNFSASLFAQDWEVSTFFREFSVNVADQEQSLNITFSPFLTDFNDSYVFINGIEIVSMPPNLYYTPPGDDQGVKLVGQNRSLKVENNTALGTVCRLNVGGSFIQPEDDTGMFRQWKDDTDYRDTTIPSMVLSNPGASLNYSKIQPYAAPAKVYLSGRFMGLAKTDNLIWNIFVYPGYMYLVRLHFCQYFNEMSVNDTRTDILLDNKPAEIGFDIIEATGGSLIPIYKDYLVVAGKKGETQDYQLNVTLLRNRASLNPDGFINGMEIIRLNDTEGSLAGPNPNGILSSGSALAPSQPGPPIEKSKSKKTLVIVAIGGSVISLLTIGGSTFVGVLWRLKKGKKHSRLFSCCLSSKKGRSARSKSSSLPQERCRNFSLHEIKDATNDFNKSLIIGEGGFGKVYKGEIDDGTTTVAIKRLNQDSTQGPNEFKTEIEMLSQLRHLNLVSLIGYCMEEGEMILVYEYMMKGTLREHLYDTTNEPLSWKKRLEICIEAARGLAYLHTGAAHTIIHRDIKTTNILLDENYSAKVSDFGLSRISVTNTAVSTKVKGTFGYLDPEYARRNQLTEKSDVYSFGVVLFEVLCARKAVNNKLEDGQQSLVLWVRKCIENERIYEIIDPFLMGKISPDCFNKFVEIAESCIRDNGTERPSMHDVKEKLEFALELQEVADSETSKKGIDPVYPELSFCAPRYVNIVGGSTEASDISMNMSDTSYSGVNTNHGFESATLTSTARYSFTDATKSGTTL